MRSVTEETERLLNLGEYIYRCVNTTINTKRHYILKQKLNVAATHEAAAKLIDDAGLRGFRIGDAMVSEKHCGFVVNMGNATFSDVTKLISHIQSVVYEKFGVNLEPEVKIIK